MINKDENKKQTALSAELILFTLCSLLFFSHGCAGAPKHKHYIRQDFAISSVKRVAVLPLENYTSDNYAGERIRKTIITEILSRGIDVIEPGEVTKTLTDLKVKSLGALSVKEAQNLQKTLGVEAVIMGAVDAYGISAGISVSYPEVSIQLMLLDASSGSIVWSVWHTSGGASFWTRHFGTEGMSLSEAAKKVVKETVDTLF
ncbi:MAG: DUF799 family lipoprotein [Nitrospirota bacterium]|nr:DUF799 family lipoprotein [Nitrospirota bacterium]